MFLSASKIKKTWRLSADSKVKFNQNSKREKILENRFQSSIRKLERNKSFATYLPVKHDYRDDRDPTDNHRKSIEIP